MSETNPTPAVHTLPWWSRPPDIRVTLIAGFFALAWRILYMVEANPALLNSAPFMTITTLILGGTGLGALSAYYFGGTKTGSEVMSAQNASLTKGTGTGGGKVDDSAQQA